MALKISSAHKVVAKRGTAVRAYQSGTTVRGGEVWVIARDGHETTIVSTGSSTATMDDAVALYSRTLKRLAKR